MLKSYELMIDKVSRNNKLEILKELKFYIINWLLK